MSMDVYPSSSLPPAITLAAVIVVTAGLVAGVVVAFARARSRDALAARAEADAGAKPPPLVEGKDVLLAGVVRHLEDRDVAVKIRITQEGTETESSGSWSHKWTEIDREIVLAPFILELASGEHVLVEPPKNVEVADELDEKVWIDRNHRVLSAELVAGEKIYARGQLARSDRASATGAYRDVAWGWALHSSRGQMLLSSEPLGDGLRQRASFHRRWAWLAILLLAITHMSLAGYDSRLVGHTVMRPITSLHRDQTTDSDGDTTDYFMVDVAGHGTDVAERDFAELNEGDQIPVRYGSAANWQLGSAATVSWFHVGALMVAASVLWVTYRSRRRASRPWFRRKVHESGSGPLPPPS